MQGYSSKDDNRNNSSAKYNKKIKKIQIMDYVQQSALVCIGSEYVLAVSMCVRVRVRVCVCVSARAVLIVESDCCRKERPAVPIHHTPRVSQPITEGAAQ